MAKTHVKVFVTRALKFRAKIKEEGKPAYEVTIGGKSWENGKGLPYRHLIYQLCRSIVLTLDNERLDIIYPPKKLEK